MQDQLQRRGHTVYGWILLVLGGAGAIGALVQFGRGALRGNDRIDNPVFANVQRLPHEQTMLYHASSYGTDLLIILPWLLFLLLTAYVGAVLLHAFYRSAPVAALIAGAFLAGAQIAGLLIATSLQKVAEFVSGRISWIRSPAGRPSAPPGRTSRRAAGTRRSPKVPGSWSWRPGIRTSSAP